MAQLQLDFMDILLTEKDDATNTITAQLGNAGAKSVESVGAELWFPPGFCARPSAVSEGADPAAQALVLKNSEHDIIIGTRDNRNNDKYAELKEGETCIYAAGQDGNGAAALFMKESGESTLYTTDTGKKDGSGISLSVAPDGLKFFAPWGTLEFTVAGFFVRHHSGASIELGGVGGLPVPGVSSYCTISGGNVTCAGSVVYLGNGPAYSQTAFTLAPLVAPAPAPTTPAITTLSASNTVYVSTI